MLQFGWVRLFYFRDRWSTHQYLHSPSPSPAPRASSALWTPDFCLFLLPCVNPLVEVWPVCIEGGGGRLLQELMNVNTSWTELQFTFSQLIRRVSPSIPYVSYEQILSAIKIRNLPSPKWYDEYLRLFIMYLAPSRPPLPLHSLGGAEGAGFLFCPPR